MKRLRFVLFIKTVTTIAFTSILLFSCTCNKSSTDNNNRLWYTYPAKYWNSQALHLGNGYIGASFFGGVEEEVFAISEASMWSGEPALDNWEKVGVNPKAKESLPLIREAIVSGDTRVADSLVMNDFFGTSEKFGYFTSAGKLNIKFPDHKTEAENYLRTLDLSNSLGMVMYDINNTTYKREYFCSYPDRILAARFSASQQGKISFNLSMDIMQDLYSVEISEKRYHVKGYINGNHRPFDVLIAINNEGGTVGQEDGYLTVRDSDVVELYLTVATNYEMKYPDYTGVDPVKTTSNIIRNLTKYNYDQLKDRHIKDYRTLYDRVTLSLEGNKEAEKLPTNERYKRLKSGESDPGYKVLAFNLGRYMIISSSRPNTLPANLQGIWNIFQSAPWRGNYQSNINIQQIYWSCGPTDLPECQQSYIDWIENLAIPGREIARRVYGTNGWVSHSTGNIWGHAAPIGALSWGMFPMGAAWHCQHAWDQFAFTMDTLYLQKQAYPLLRDASVFWLENLIPFEGYLITAPTVSAEQSVLMTETGLNPDYNPGILKSDNYHYNIPGVYQDIQMLTDLFTNTSEAAKILGDLDFADSLLKTRERLLPLKIGQYGQLQEWYEDIDSPDCHHRHISHLYAVYPGTQIHPTITPELAVAAKKSLDMRGDGRFIKQELASGGNWARAHRMWCWTRLLDGNRANKIMTEMLTEQGFENGLTFQHVPRNPPSDLYQLYPESDLGCNFQLDGSASLPGCIAEMLVQSHLGEIHLLPALPDEFKTGKISGLKARGGYTINMEWKNGKLTWADIHIPNGYPGIPVRLENEIINLDEYKNIKFKRAN